MPPDTPDRAALRDARAAIASLDEDALGRDPQHGWSYRNELLHKIDLALATPARAVPSEAAIEAACEASAHTVELGMAKRYVPTRTIGKMLAAAYAVDFPHSGEEVRHPSKDEASQDAHDAPVAETPTVAHGGELNTCPDCERNRLLLLEVLGRVGSVVSYLRTLDQWTKLEKLDLLPPIPIPPVLREQAAHGGEREAREALDRAWMLVEKLGKDCDYIIASYRGAERKIEEPLLDVVCAIQDARAALARAPGGTE